MRSCTRKHAETVLFLFLILHVHMCAFTFQISIDFFPLFIICTIILSLTYSLYFSNLFLLFFFVLFSELKVQATTAIAWILYGHSFSFIMLASICINNRYTREHLCIFSICEQTTTQRKSHLLFIFHTHSIQHFRVNCLSRKSAHSMASSHFWLWILA